MTENATPITVINTFTLGSPEDQQKLARILIDTTEEVMKHLPGFISATFYQSLDGTQITNVAQWRSKEDFESMLRSSLAMPHRRATQEIATRTGNTYQVVYATSLENA